MNETVEQTERKESRFLFESEIRLAQELVRLGWPTARIAEVFQVSQGTINAIMKRVENREHMRTPEQYRDLTRPEQVQPAVISKSMDVELTKMADGPQTPWPDPVIAERIIDLLSVCRVVDDVVYEQVRAESIAAGRKQREKRVSMRADEHARLIESGKRIEALLALLEEKGVHASE